MFLAKLLGRNDAIHLTFSKHAEQQPTTCKDPDEIKLGPLLQSQIIMARRVYRATVVDRLRSRAVTSSMRARAGAARRMKVGMLPAMRFYCIGQWLPRW